MKCNEIVRVLVTESLNIECGGAQFSTVMILCDGTCGIDQFHSISKGLCRALVVASDFVTQRPNENGRVISVSSDHVLDIVQLVLDGLIGDSTLTDSTSKVSVLVHGKHAQSIHYLVCGVVWVCV